MVDNLEKTDEKSERHTQAETCVGQPVLETVQVDREASESKHQPNSADNEIGLARRRRCVEGIHQWAPNVLGFLTVAVLAFQAVIFSERSTWMREQSKATNDALTESRKAREIEDRAYVAVIEVVLDNPIRSSGEQVTAKLRAMNTGRTPAINFKSQVWSGTNPPNANVPLAPPATLPPGSQGILMPERTWNTTTTTQLNDPEKSAFSTAGSHLYVWGIFEYDDFFGGHHTTQFCFVNGSFTGVEFVPCPGGNWMN